MIDSWRGIPEQPGLVFVADDPDIKRVRYCEVAREKVCSCGARYTRGQWAELVAIGTSKLGGDTLTMRICKHCGSTLSVALELESGS